MWKGLRVLMIPVALCGVLVLGLSACAATSPVPEAQPMPQGGTFEGLWYSNQFEHMYLKQQGDQVSGVYAYGAGGILEGEVDGNLLVFSWHEPGDRSELRRDRSGHGYFQLVEGEDSLELVGQWGYDAEYAGGGPWTAEFIREARDGDPQTIAEIKEVH